jgi:hypothetical protein
MSYLAQVEDDCRLRIMKEVTEQIVLTAYTETLSSSFNNIL